MTPLVGWLALLLLAGAAACGGESGSPTAAEPPRPARLRLVDGDGQVHVVSTELPAPLRVLAEDASGRPLKGIVVAWSTAADAGIVLPYTTSTDSLGIATARWSLGKSSGTYTATATVEGVPPVTFSARAVVSLCVKYGEAPGVQVTCGVDYVWISVNGPMNRKMDVFAPAAGAGPFPVVLALPGGCQGREDVEWVGPQLAARGYVVAVASIEVTRGHDFGREDCVVAALAATRHLTSPGNPYIGISDTTRLGGLGWSLGAHVLSALQDIDARYGAIVAWDNLGVNEYADADSLVRPHRPPRVPAMGQASERACEGTGPCGPDAKKYAYEQWRVKGIPSMQLVLAGSDHGAFAEIGTADLKPFIAYYTLNWFDRWLKDDRAATARLLADPVAAAGAQPRSRTGLLSGTWRSAAFLDGRDCPDLRAGCS